MKAFFKFNIYALVIFWLIFLANFLIPIGGELSELWIMRIGIALLVIHALELVVVFKGLKKIDRTSPVDIIWVLLIGLFHWKPLLSK
mgnify:CR=1 FL=1